VAAGVGALAAGAVARRVLFAGAAGGAKASVGTAAAAPRALARRGAAAVADRLGSAGATAGDWVWRFLAAAGYAKRTTDDPLAHETRAELYDHVQAAPGTYLSAFDDAPALDASLGTIRYHLKVLEREGLVTSEKVGGKRRYYPVGGSPDALDVALASESTRALLEALLAAPDTVSGLAERVDRDPSTVSHHLSRLEADGLIERERDGQAVTNRLTPGVERVLASGPFADRGAGTERSAADD
jgi:DNA-binding transcriptional ArsR family regulator